MLTTINRHKSLKVYEKHAVSSEAMISEEIFGIGDIKEPKEILFSREIKL